MPLNPEQFGLDVAAAPWAGVRRLASLVISPANVTNPILAYIEQNKAERNALFATGRRLDLRSRNPVLGIGAQIMPPPPDADRRER